MKEFLNYYFNASDVADGDFSALYETRRRDSGFAFAYEDDSGHIFALRDHLGIVPLYYRFEGGTVRFATNLTSLVRAGDALNPAALDVFLKFGTPRLCPLIEAIQIVPPGTVIEIDPVGGTSKILYVYRLQPRRVSVWTRSQELVEECERLLTQSLERTIQSGTVGLYLSGGIDSALIGIYLRRLGAQVRAYTSAPWGRISSEIPFAEKNAAVVGMLKHHIEYLETGDYPPLLMQLLDIYGIPHGSPTSLGVTSLWAKSAIGDETELYHGLNLDTAFGAVPALSHIFWLHRLPRIVRQRLHPAFRKGSVTAILLALVKRYEGSELVPHEQHIRGKPSDLQRLILGAMFNVIAPSDGETLTQPAIERGIKICSPYCDADFVEFLMGLPLRHRVTLSKESPIRFNLEKRIFQQLAERYLPHDLVHRKKAFIVSFDRDATSRNVMGAFPTSFRGAPLEHLQERFAAFVLKMWAEKYQIGGWQ